MAALERLERLIDDELLVDGLEDVGADDGMQVGLHVVEDKVDVLVVLRLVEVAQLDDVRMRTTLIGRRRAAWFGERGAPGGGAAAFAFLASESMKTSSPCSIKRYAISRNVVLRVRRVLERTAQRSS